MTFVFYFANNKYYYSVSVEAKDLEQAVAKLHEHCSAQEGYSDDIADYIDDIHNGEIVVLKPDMVDEKQDVDELRRRLAEAEKDAKRFKTVVDDGVVVYRETDSDRWFFGSARVPKEPEDNGPFSSFSEAVDAAVKES